MSAAELTKLRRRRGVPKGSITRIETRLDALEEQVDHPNLRDAAKQMLAKLKEQDVEFRRSHMALIDMIDNDEELSDEQAVLDDHDDIVASLTVRILKLIDDNTSTTTVSTRELLSRRCDRLEARIAETDAVLETLTSADVCKLQQYQEQLLDFKKEV